MNAFALMESETETETDGALMRVIAAQGVDPDSARRAQEVFYQRHVRYLYGVLRRRCQRAFGLSDSATEDLVQDTFCRAFERAATFRDDGITDPVRLERRTRAWLGRIAERLLADSLNRLREVSASPYLETLGDDSLDCNAEASPETVLLVEALDTLSERERDVLSVSATYLRLGEQHQRLPNAVCSELALRWNVSPENIRAIRSRAMKKLKGRLLGSGAGAREP